MLVFLLPFVNAATIDVHVSTRAEFETMICQGFHQI